MAISIDWPTRVISIPKADLLLVQSTPIEIRQLDIDAFRLELHDVQDGEGMPFPDIFSHVAPISVGGVTLARVLEIINGYTITFEDGSYAVNIAGGNSNVGDVVNLNSVSVRSANSAGLTYSKEIEDQSFAEGRIFVDTALGSPGTTYPRGTTTSPVNNYLDALTIAVSRNLPFRFLFKGGVTLAGEDISGVDVIGTRLPFDSIDFNGATTTGATFRNLMLTGAHSGSFTAFDCVLMDLSGFNGFLFGGAIGGTLTLAAGEVHLVNTHAAAAGTDQATIDFSGQAVDGFIPGWEGGMIIANHSHASSKTAIDVRSGTITLASTCTAGTIVIRGQCELIDNSGPGCTVVTTGLAPDATSIANAVWNADLVDYVTAGTMGERMAAEIAMVADIQDTVDALPSAAQISNSVWTSAAASYTTDGTMGADLIEAMSRVADVWAIEGLDQSRPMTVTPSSRIAGSISQSISGNGTTSSIVTRTS